MTVNCHKIFIYVVLLFLVGCKTDLYSGLSQKEGNEMLAILLSEGIDTVKEIDSEGMVKLLVDESQLSKALTALKNQGYPKEKFATLEKIFPDEGLISSPVAEKARLMYVKSQEIASTIAQIDGVVTARVHIVRPEENKSRGMRKKEKQHSSASVFIKHIPDVDIESLVPQIKLLVNNSIEDINYDRISVILVPTFFNRQQSNREGLVNLLFINVAKSSKTAFIILIGIFSLLLLGSNMFNYYWFNKKRK